MRLEVVASLLLALAATASAASQVSFEMREKNETERTCRHCLNPIRRVFARQAPAIFLFPLSR